MIRRGLLACMAVLGLAAGPAMAERITDHGSKITIHEDGAVTVVETITVAATGDKIKRVIYRDFPTDYEDSHGNRVRVRFEVLEVQRDGVPEPYHTVRRGNEVRVYIGSPDVNRAPDDYVYTLTYRTHRQIGFFDDFDELYFNAVSHGWEFPIERARATVHLPGGAEVLSTNAFTGRQGSKGQDYTSGPGANGGTVFRVTRPLGPREGLTIVIAWPKGYVAAPTLGEQVGHLLSDNAGLLPGLIGLVVIFAYYLLAWFRVGRDPQSGTIVPLFEPPEDLSPAAMRFIMGMGYDKKAFTAAIVNVAVKGYLTIAEDDGEFTLWRNHKDMATLSPGEAQIARWVLSTYNKIRLHHTNHASIENAIVAFKNCLREEFAKVHFQLNWGYFAFGVLVSVFALIAIAAEAPSRFLAGVMMVWLSAWTASCAFIVATAFLSWRHGDYVHAVRMGLFSIAFLAGEFFGLEIVAEAASLASSLLLVAIIVVNVLFYYLLKAPTFTGRRLMDRIEGFKLYLSVAEKLN